MRKKRGEIDNHIHTRVRSENKGDPMETSKVKFHENDHQNEDLAEVVADLKRQLLLSKFCIERFKNSDDDIYFFMVFQIVIYKLQLQGGML